MDNGDVKGAVKEMQSSFNSLSFSEDIKGNFDKIFKDIIKEAEQFEARVNGSFEKIGDVNALKKNADHISNLFSKLTKELSQMSNKDISEIFNIDVSGVTKINKKIEELQQKISQIGSGSIEKVSNSFKELSAIWKNAGKSDIIEQLKSGDLEGASASFEKLEKHLIAFTRGGATAKASIERMMEALNAGDIQAAEQALSELLVQAKGADTTKFRKFGEEVIKIGQELTNAKREVEQFSNEINQLQDDKMSIIAIKTEEATQNLQQLSTVAKTADSNFDRMKGSIIDSARATQTLQQEIQQVGNRAAYFLSLENMVDLFRRGVNKAIETVKELDKAMTETAVVTDFSVGDMWKDLPRYTKVANELGTTTLGAYETMTLFYQQGLKTNEVFAIGTETMKMARIAGLDYAKATDLMTAALRGFNMELNELSAQRVNDVYSELAAITAADTQEIANAMTKTASIAKSANMEFETTAALLSQIIETTREPAETAGTALKTIIARFTEMKKSASEIVSVDGEEVNVNKVEAALKDAGVALRDVNGEFRDLDDVFLELSSKWNNLDQMTQRYVATMAAGSRQQSRFIAMMQDYGRTMELVDAAYDSSGASQKQFEKTQESLESKINKLNNAIDTFLMGIADDKIIKGFIDALTKLITGFNKLTESAGGLGGSILRLGTIFAGLRLAKTGIEKVITNFVGLKHSIESAADSSKKLTLLTKFAERLDNFKLGQGFRMDVDIDTTKFQKKKAKLLADWNQFRTILNQKAQFKFSGFEVNKEGISELFIKSATTGEMVKVQLSEAGAAALRAGKSAEEFGKELAEAGLEGKVAQELLQKEIDQTVLKMNALNEGTTVTKNGKTYKVKDSKKIEETQKTLDDLRADQADIVDASAQGTGTLATGFSSLGSSIAGALPYILAVAAALAAIAATAYAIYNASPLKKAKNEAEVAAGAVNDYSRALEKANEETSALNSILNELKGREQIFDNLVAGSVEWYQNISDINEKLLEQISLLQQLGYNIDYSYDENGMIQVKNQEQLRAALIAKEQQKTELQKGQTAATYGAEVASKKSQFIDQNFDKEKEAFGERFLKGMGATTATAGATLAGSTAIGAAIGSSILPGIGTALMGTIGFGVGSIAAAAEMVVGAIGSLVHATIDGTNAVEEAANSGVYDGLTEDQKQALDTKSQEAAAATWKLYAKNEKELEAGLKIIQNTNDAYEHFYSNEALSKQLGNKFEVADFDNSELVYEGGKDIKASDIDEDFLKDLGYSGWGEAAQALGLQWDSTKGGVAGLYTTVGEGDNQKKQYFDVTNHGQVDKETEWEDLMADPSGKNIDAGFLALKLATMKGRSTGLAGMISDVLDEEITEQILYGTEDWSKAVTETDFSDITDDAIKDAVVKAVNQANTEKNKIYDSIVNTETKDKEGKTNKIFETIDEQAVKDFASNIQKMATDINETTALAYQTFITSKMDNLDNVTTQTLQDLENQYQQVFSQIDVTDSIGTLDSLNQMIAEGVSEAKELKDSLIAAGSISASKSFEQLYKSGILDELGEDIAKIADEAGNIDVTATRELVDSNVELKKIMDEFNVSGYAMGKVLTDIQSGEITLTEINNGLIESYKLLYSAMGQAEDVLYDLRNADLGEDYTEIGRTYEERYNTIKDLYKRKAYGSENFGGNISSLIGEEEWNRYLSENNGNAKTAWEKVSSDYKLGKNDGNLYGSFSSLISKYGGGGIFSNTGGKISYDLSGVKNYDDLLDKMVTNFKISRQYAKAMLADMATYSATLQSDLNGLNAAANAKITYQKMYHVNNDEGKTTASYTSMSDSQIKTAFENTKEWEDAKNKVKKAWEDEESNKGKTWENNVDEKTRNQKTTEQFKTDSKIYNTVDINGKERQIENVDSYGNIYYRDENGKVQIEEKEPIRKQETVEGEIEKTNKDGSKGTITTTVVQDVDFELTGDAEADYEKIKSLGEDELVIQAATELNDEEFQAWLTAYTGNENMYSAMINAGITPESLASVAAAKDEMITQIQGVAQALETLEVTIPITLGGEDTALMFGDVAIPIWLPGFKTSVTVGGEGTTTNPVGSPPTTSGTGSINFTPTIDTTTGTGYDNGSDPENNPPSGGGDKEKNDTNPKLENLNNKLENLERQYENKEIGALEYEQKKKDLLKEQQSTLQADINKDYASSKYKDYFYYDKASDSYLLNEAKFNKANDKTKNAIMEDYERINGKNDDLNDIEDLLEKLLKGNKYDTTNEKAQLEYLDKDVKNNRIDLTSHSDQTKELMTSEINKLTSQFKEKLNESANKDLFNYDENSGQLLLNQEKFLKLSEEEQEAVKQEYEYLKSINDEAMDLEDALNEMVENFSSVNEEASIEYLNWMKENGLISVEEYDKAVKAEESVIASNALSTFLEKIEGNKNFESGLMYRNEETGMVEIDQEKYKKLNTTDQTAAKKLMEELNGYFLTYLQYSGQGDKAGNQNDVTNENARLEDIERSRSKEKLSASAYTRLRDTELNSKYDKLSNQLKKELADSENKEMFDYDESTGELLLNMDKFNELSEEGQAQIKEEYETLQDINREMKDIKDTLEDTDFGRFSTFGEDQEQQYADYRYNAGYSDAGRYNERSGEIEQSRIKTLEEEQKTYKTDEDVYEGHIKQNGQGGYEVDKEWYDSLKTDEERAAADEKVKKFNENLKDYDPDVLSGDILIDPETGEASLNEDRRASWTQELETKVEKINSKNIELKTLKDKQIERAESNYDSTAQIDEDLKNLQHRYDTNQMSASKYVEKRNKLQTQAARIYKNKAGKAFSNKFFDEFMYYDDKGQMQFNETAAKDAGLSSDEINRKKDELEDGNKLISNLENISKNWTYDKKSGMFKFVDGLSEEIKEKEYEALENANKAIGANPNLKYVKEYDEETGEIIWTDEYFALNEESQLEVLRSFEEGSQALDLWKQAVDVMRDPEYRKEGNRQLDQKGEAQVNNAEQDMSSLQSREKELAGYNSLISKLPEQVQGPLNLATSALGMVYQAEESQILRAQVSGLEVQKRVAESESWAFEEGLIKYDPTTKTYKMDWEEWGAIEDAEIRNQAKTDYDNISGIQSQINNINDQRNGGIFQKPFYMAEEAAENMQEAFNSLKKETEDMENITDRLDAAFKTLEEELGLTSGSLNKFKEAAEKFIKQGFYDKDGNPRETEKKFESAGLLSQEQIEGLKNSKIGSYIGEDSLNLLTSLIGKDATGGKVQTSYVDLFDSIIGSFGEAAGFTGDLLSFEMIGMGLDMVNQIKGMIEQFIGYITQATQTIVNAWTNREDYLYNFLQVIEKHLQEYEKLQRYQTQIENGRLTTSQEILNNWNEQWKSLQQQLEEQTERVEARQKELDRSRFNPFILLSGWDPTSDTLYENREPKFIFDLVIGAGEAVNFMGTGAFFSQINQLYEDYDSRVQKSYEDRLAAEQALLDIEDQRVELVKIGSDEATRFEQKLLDAMIQKEQEAIDELTRLNEAVTDANSKLMNTLKDNLDKIRQDRENEKKEEELGEKERRLAYLRQDTSGANLMEIKKLEEELDEGHEDYTDNLIDQKISELEKQNELAAEQRERQIELLQGQLDYAEKYGLYWDAIYGMLYTIDENGNVILNPDNFDLDGNIRENSELAKLLGTFSDRMGMSTWSSVLDNEEAKRLGRYYGAFIGMNGVDGNWANRWALENPGANDPNYSTPQQEIPEGIWGVLYNLESSIKTYFSNSDLGLVNMFGRADQGVKNFFGKLFGNDELANFKYDGPNNNSTFFSGIKGIYDDASAWATKNFGNPLKDLIKIFESQNNGVDNRNINIIVEIDKFGESIGLDELTDSVVSTVKSLFYPNGVAQTRKGR